MKNMYTPEKSQFCYLKVGYKGYTLHGHVYLKGVYITQTCLRDGLFLRFSYFDLIVKEKCLLKND